MNRELLQQAVESLREIEREVDGYATVPRFQIANKARKTADAIESALQQQPEVDPLFKAAHYQEGRDLLPDGVGAEAEGQR